MNAVIEIDEVRQIMDPIPLKRNIPGKTLANGRQHRCVGPQLGMTGHTSVGRRHSGERGFFDGRVAVTAINSEASDVMGVAEWHRLIQRNIHPSRERGPVECVQRPSARHHEGNQSGNADASDRIGTAMKNLRHYP